MKALGCLLSIPLIILSFAALMFFTVVSPEARAENETIANLQNSLFCDPNEQYVEVLGGRVTESLAETPDEHFPAYCADAEGQEREVTERSFAIMAGAFAVPFLIGLALGVGSLIAFSRSASRNVVRAAMQSGDPMTVFTNLPQENISVITVDGRQMDSLPPEAAEVIKQVMGSFGATASQFTSPGANDLAGKLRQLQEARDAGLITEEEFTRVRQQIMDGMDGGNS